MEGLKYKINFWIGYIGSAIIAAIMIMSPAIGTSIEGLCMINLIAMISVLCLLYLAIFEDYEKAYGDKNDK